MSQEHGYREQAGIFARGEGGHTPDEHVEVVADVEFFEQRVQQPVAPRETVRPFG